MREKINVECPCCKGKGWLELYDASFTDDDGAELVQHVPCCHCSAKGYVLQESERVLVHLQDRYDRP